MEEQKVVQPAPPVNPLVVKLRLPGQMFRLPSQGLFYDDGELDPSVQRGEVEVFPMTALDEIVMSTPDKLLNGKAIVEVFGRCVPQVLKAERLLTKDVDFLMGCLRLVSFGPTVSVKHRHTCEAAKMHEYSIDLEGLLRAARSIDPTLINTQYKIPMPNGQMVTLKPLTFDRVIELYQTTALSKQAEDMTIEEVRLMVISTIAGVIKDVDSTTDQKMIEEWVTKIPLGWKKLIEETAQKISNWGADFSITKPCKDCGADLKLEFTPNAISFFT